MGASIRRNRRRFDSHVSNERWLVSYSDFITLLFAFFVTMYAISNVDARKLSEMVESMQRAFDAQRPPVRNSPSNRTSGERRDPGALDDLQEQLAKRLSSQIQGGLVGLEIDPRGLVITIREAGTFATGRADLSDSARALLAEVTDAIVGLPNLVRVEGHTDDVPIHTERFRSNWELSTARATTVIAFMVQERHLDPTRLSAAGYGEFHPRTKNVDDAARAQNRRVDIIILNETTQRSEEPRAAQAAPPTGPGAAAASGASGDGVLGGSPRPASGAAGRGGLRSLEEGLALDAAPLTPVSGAATAASASVEPDSLR